MIFISVTFGSLRLANGAKRKQEREESEEGEEGEEDGGGAGSKRKKRGAAAASKKKKKKGATGKVSVTDCFDCRQIFILSNLHIILTSHGLSFYFF